MNLTNAKIKIKIAKSVYKNGPADGTIKACIPISHTILNIAFENIILVIL